MKIGIKSWDIVREPKVFTISLEQQKLEINSSIQNDLQHDEKLYLYLLLN